MSVTCNDLELTQIPTILSSESVNSLDLSYNILGEVKELVFKDYNILENLILSYNEIERVDSTAFNGLKMLINIDLSYNKLQFIPPTIFSDNPLLQTVSFSGNPLESVPDSTPILVSPSVTSLDLSYCDLTSVNRHTFSQLPALQVLDLNSNKLREFNSDILNTLTEIAVIDFGNNQWKCDCNIVEVLNWLSVRRRSKGLLGEHKPVDCVEAGIQKTIWPSTSKNELRSEETEMLPKSLALKLPLAGLNSTTDAKFSADTPKTSDSKKEIIDISTLGIRKDGLLSVDIDTFLGFIVLLFILGLNKFMNTVEVNYYHQFYEISKEEKVTTSLKKEVLVNINAASVKSP
jgi:hypothetical protein